MEYLKIEIDSMANPFDDKLISDQRKKYLKEQRYIDALGAEIEAQKIERAKLIAERQQKERQEEIEKKKGYFIKYIQHDLSKHGKAYITLVDKKYYVYGRKAADKCDRGAEEATDIEDFSSIQMDLLSAGYVFVDHASSGDSYAKVICIKK